MSRLTEVLVAHQRLDADGCVCGALLRIGESHAEHVEAELFAVGVLGPEDADRLRRALAGHLFDRESLSTREAIRSELVAWAFRFATAIEMAIKEADSMVVLHPGLVSTDDLRVMLRRASED